MSNRIVSIRGWLILLLTVAAIAGCGDSKRLSHNSSGGRADNGQARLLRIDGDRFDLQEYAIRFDEREGRDIGFGALAFAADGTLFARTTPGGLLWKIDIAKGSAIMIEVNKKLPPDECAMTAQFLNDFDWS